MQVDRFEAVEPELAERWFSISARLELTPASVLVSCALVSCALVSCALVSCALGSSGLRTGEHRVECCDSVHDLACCGCVVGP